MPLPIMAIAFGVSMAATAAGTYMSMKGHAADAQSSLDKAMYDKTMAQMNAERIREASRQKASRILERARYMRGTQAAQAANAGVWIGEGSAGQMQDETDRLISRDAMVALYQGIEGDVAERQRGEMAYRAGESASEASSRAATGALISGVGQMAGSYHTYKGLTTER